MSVRNMLIQRELPRELFRELNMSNAERLQRLRESEKPPSEIAEYVSGQRLRDRVVELWIVRSQ
jgi:hypothetical protein